MNRHLFVCLGLSLILATAANAKKINPRINLVTKNGDIQAVKAPTAKLSGVGIIVSTTGYGDAWRATVGMAGKSIVVDPTGTYIGIVFGTKNDSLCDMLFGFSLDGGTNWVTKTIDSNMNVRIYNGMALDSINRPYIVWQDKNTNSIIWAKDADGIGAGLWTPPDTLAKDTIAWYLPVINIKGNKLIISANNFNDNSIHMVLSNNLGSTWQPPWDITFPFGWHKWAYNEISGQNWGIDPADWLISGSGDTIVAFFEAVCDTNLYIAEGGYAGFYPVYKMSFDGGVTWGAMQKFDLPPQYNYGGWWYLYDGAWIGDRPYLLYTHQDGVWNGSALFVYYPTVAGDYSNWTCKRISDIPGNLAGVTPGDLNGGEANFPTLSYDADGNIYAIYADYPKDGDSYEIFGVASTDNGATWLNPVQLTTQAPELNGNIYLEAAEFSGGDKIHMLFHDPAYTNIYYWNVPTSTILAGGTRPEEISLAPELVGSDGGGWGGPIDTVMDTVQGPGDTLTTYWAPKVALGGTYQVQICKSADFLSSVYLFALSTNYFTTIGLPDTNVVWYWRVRSVKVTDYSPWSAVYDFYYKGSTINWYHGVNSEPDLLKSYKYILEQSRPNPANKEANLSFTLPKSGNYRLKIYNISGQVVKTLDGKGNAGKNTVTWNGLDNGGRKAANGVYLYNLQAFGNSATKKMIVLR